MKRRRKGKGKGKGKGKSARKNRKPGKGKGKKKGKGNKGRKSSRNGKGRKLTEDRTSANSTCFETAIFYMKLWKDVVSNFEKQKARMEKQNSTGGNKAGKKGAFAPIAFKLVDIGGGNKTNMSCGGAYGNKGAQQLQNLTKTLFDCELSVNKSCNPANFPQPNFTFINNCNKLVGAFKFSVQICINKSIGATKANVSDACGCWLGPQLADTANSIKSCKASKEATAISKQFKACKSAFSVCRKYEDAAIPSIMACAQSSTGLTKKAATLSANSNALTEAKTKISALAGSSNSSGRVVRAVATSCAEILSKTKALIRKASNFPAKDLTTEAAEITGVSSSVTCSNDEKNSLSTQVTSIEVAITVVKSALSSVQTLLSTLTGSTASSSVLASGAPSGSGSGSGSTMSTAAPSGRRDRIV